MRYFRFFPDCQFIAGPVRGTIYFTAKAKTCHLSKTESLIVKSLLSDESVDEVLGKYPAEGKPLLDRFIQEGFGAYFERPVFGEPYFPRCRFEIRGLLESPPAMRFACLQLSAECDGKCGFCGDDAFHHWQGCNSCLRWPCGDRGRQLRLEDLAKTIEDLIHFNVQCVIFSGGNPLMNFDAVAAVSRRFQASGKDIQVKVNTNGRHLTESVARTAQELGMAFTFSVFGSSRAEYGMTTGDPQRYDHLVRAVMACKERQIPYDVALVVPAELRSNYQRVWEFASSLGGRTLFYTEILPKHGERRKVLSLPTGSRRIQGVRAEEFFRRQKFNFCLSGNIAVASNGALLPCPSWAEPIGNIHTERDLRHLFRSQTLMSFWEQPKEKLPACGTCENRYSCVDCSVLEWGTHEDASVRDCFCDYVPESGEWRPAEEA